MRITRTSSTRTIWLQSKHRCSSCPDCSNYITAVISIVTLKNYKLTFIQTQAPVTTQVRIYYPGTAQQASTPNFLAKLSRRV